MDSGISLLPDILLEIKTFFLIPCHCTFFRHCEESRGRLCGLAFRGNLLAMKCSPISQQIASLPRTSQPFGSQ